MKARIGLFLFLLAAMAGAACGSKESCSSCKDACRCNNDKALPAVPPDESFADPNRPPAPGLDDVSLDGNRVSLADYKGRVVLVCFWASWCPACVRDLPAERDLAAKFAGRPFAVIGVNADATRIGIIRRVAELKPAGVQVWDNGGGIRDQWNVHAIPHYALLDVKGNVVRRWTGGGKLPAIGEAVEATLKEAGK